VEIVGVVGGEKFNGDGDDLGQ